MEGVHLSIKDGKAGASLTAPKLWDGRLVRRGLARHLLASAARGGQVCGVHPGRLRHDVPDGQYEAQPRPQEAGVQGRLHADMGQSFRLHVRALQGQSHSGGNPMSGAWDVLDEAA